MTMKVDLGLKMDDFRHIFSYTTIFDYIQSIWDTMGFKSSDLVKFAMCTLVSRDVYAFLVYKTSFVPWKQGYTLKNQPDPVSLLIYAR